MNKYMKKGIKVRKLVMNLTYEIYSCWDTEKAAWYVKLPVVEAYVAYEYVIFETRLMFLLMVHSLWISFILRTCVLLL